MLKRKCKRLLALACCLLLACTLMVGLHQPVAAEEELDYIRNYTVTVWPCQDGSMDIRYDVVWEVLDDEAYGPLTWAQLGIPNDHVIDVQALDGPISEVSTTGEDGESYLRVDFTRPFYEGDVVEFAVGFNASYLYQLEGDEDTPDEDRRALYTLTPGWFSAARVGQMDYYWLRDGVASFSVNSYGGGDWLKQENYEDFFHLRWKNLEPDARLSITAAYPQSAFADLDESKQISDLEDDIWLDIAALTLLLIIALLILRGGTRRRRHWYGGFGPVIIPGGRRDGGSAAGKPGQRPSSGRKSGGSGFGGFGGGSTRGGGAGRSSGCACACASCACACACAGGGRAGCSAKNFAGASADTEAVLKRLRKK